MRIHALIGTDEFYDCPSLGDLPAYQKLPLDNLNPNQSLEVLDEAKEESEELRLLMG